MWTSDNEIWLRTSQELFSERGARYFDKSIEYVYVFTNSLEYSDYTETFLLEDETVVYSTENVNFFPMSFQHFSRSTWKKLKEYFWVHHQSSVFKWSHIPISFSFTFEHLSSDGRKAGKLISEDLRQHRSQWRNHCLLLRLLGKRINKTEGQEIFFATLQSSIYIVDSTIITRRFKRVHKSIQFYFSIFQLSKAH